MAVPPLSEVAVTFVSSHALLGGSERYLETLLARLGPGWARRVISLQRGPANERLRAAGFPPLVLHTSGSWVSILVSSWRLRRLLRQDRPEVLHANGVKAALVCVLATVGLSLPVIWVKHDFSWDGPLVSAIAVCCSEVIGVCAAVTEALPRRARVSVVRLGVEQEPVDAEQSRRAVRALLYAPPTAPVAALVARMHPDKGHTEVLAVVPEVLEHVPDARFAFLGGEDPSQAEYAALVRRQAEGLGEAVTVLGHRDDAIALLAGCDVMVVPSVCREGASLATVEAMALGKAVVAYADGGLPEVIGDGGWLVPPGDRKALAQAIARVLGDRGLQRDLGERAEARAVERYSLERTIEAMKDRYRSAARRW